MVAYDSVQIKFNLQRRSHEPCSRDSVGLMEGQMWLNGCRARLHYI